MKFLLITHNNSRRNFEMKENINALDELSKGCCMGEDAINFVMEKVQDNKFKNVIDKQHNNYEALKAKIDEVYPKYNKEDDPHETNLMNKAMTWYGIEMKTLNDTSNSKIAELLIQGTNMGIIEGIKLLNNKKVDSEVENLIREYITMQEKSLEILKEYL